MRLSTNVCPQDQKKRKIVGRSQPQTWGAMNEAAVKASWPLSEEKSNAQMRGQDENTTLADIVPNMADDLDVCGVNDLHSLGRPARSLVNTVVEFWNLNKNTNEDDGCLDTGRDTGGDEFGLGTTRKTRKQRKIYCNKHERDPARRAVDELTYGEESEQACSHYKTEWLAAAMNLKLLLMDQAAHWDLKVKSPKVLKVSGV
ncbi:hypothetical protein C8J57DRAFT_1219162 [Mycena rebaudengoi]|nr:hypothetical protein C8J57DRAFT_1219162 [Mycena rebaudengoi]